MNRRIKITVLTKEDRVRIFTYANENSPQFREYIKDSLDFLPDGGKIVLEDATEEDNRDG